MSIEAWTSGLVPHHLTSNAMVERPMLHSSPGLLTDLGLQVKTRRKCTSLVGPAGKVGLFILQELEIMAEQSAIELPPYCY
ncbi:MAG: hypothetical protein IPP37_11000 [Saprospiraceae bacterium]|nr:hypothetical protein [Saprospiraceae bacterium]